MGIGPIQKCLPMAQAQVAPTVKDVERWVMHNLVGGPVLFD